VLYSEQRLLYFCHYNIITNTIIVVIIIIIIIIVVIVIIIIIIVILVFITFYSPWGGTHANMHVPLILVLPIQGQEGRQ
jgi:hypothetical protein